MIPDVNGRATSISSSVDTLDLCSHVSLEKRTSMSLPIYQGAIIRIEQHPDNQRTSDLIVRVPNFQHHSLSSMSLSHSSWIDDQLGDTTSQHQARVKRRAPLCPIINDVDKRSTSCEPNRTMPSNDAHGSRLLHGQRLANNLRYFTRVLATSRRSQRSFADDNDMTFIPMLPDVEVMIERFDMINNETNTKDNHANVRSNFQPSKVVPPKILGIKRKYFKIKRKRSSTISTNSEQSHRENRTSPFDRQHSSLTNKTNTIDRADEHGKRTAHNHWHTPNYQG
jgi:hypothetical protein